TSTLAARIPGFRDTDRNFEWCVGPAELGARTRDLFSAERSAVRILMALFSWSAPANNSLAAQQTRARCLCKRGHQCSVDCNRIVSVNIAQRLPAICFESLRCVVGEPLADFPIDRDAVVVVDGD